MAKKAGAKAEDKKPEKFEVQKTWSAYMEAYLLGTSPLIIHRMARKGGGAEELLLPKPKANRAELESRQKHDPIWEFTQALYVDRSPEGPTRVVMPNGAFKDALRDCALDLPGTVTKALAGRLTRIVGDKNDNVPIWGIPEFRFDIVRNSGPSRTPDVRTRPCLRNWAAKITIRFECPMLDVQAVAELIAAAGRIRAIGDWRTEKGSGNFGEWIVVPPDNAEWNEIVSNGGREAQDAAIANPQPYNEETAELFAWYVEEVKRRKKMAKRKPAKGNGNDADFLLEEPVGDNGSDYLIEEASV